MLILSKRTNEWLDNRLWDHLGTVTLFDWNPSARGFYFAEERVTRFPGRKVQRGENRFTQEWKKVADRIKWQILLIQSVVSLVINRIIRCSNSTIADAFQPHEYTALRKYSVVAARIKHYLESLKLSASTQILKYVIRTMIFWNGNFRSLLRSLLRRKQAVSRSSLNRTCLV